MSVRAFSTVERLIPLVRMMSASVGGVPAPFDGFVDKGCSFSQGTEYGADSVDLALPPAHFPGQLLVVSRELDQVHIG
jgi:hypothetical protein